MRMTPKDFFEGFVEGNYKDFREDDGDIRKAFNAAIAASHLADHCIAYKGRDSKYCNEIQERFCSNRAKYIKHLWKEMRYFKDIRSIANAYKHLYIGGREYSTISSAGVLDYVVIDPTEEETVSEVYPSTVLKYKTKDGNSESFMDAITEVYKYFRDRLSDD